MHSLDEKSIVDCRHLKTTKSTYVHYRKMHSLFIYCVVVTGQISEVSQSVMDPVVSYVYCNLIDFTKELQWNIEAMCAARVTLRDPQFTGQFQIEFRMFRCLSATDSIPDI